MKGFVLLLLLARFTWATSPLVVISVDRVGLPPYEDTERIYRLEGSGCQTLRVGEILVLQRQGERRGIGRLEILSVHLDHAQSRLSAPGETFPLKGDLAIRTELFHALPEVPIAAQQSLTAIDTLRPQTITRTLPQSVDPFIKGDLAIRTELFHALPEVPIAAQQPLPAIDTLRPQTITHLIGQGAIYREPTSSIKGDFAIHTKLFHALPEVPIAAQQPFPTMDTLRPQTITRTVSQNALYREPIYFLKGDASLSPGALIRLKAWVETWGVEGQWSLEYPQFSGDLLALRISALRSELQRLGIPSLAIKSLPEEPPGRYDAIYVKKEP